MRFEVALAPTSWTLPSHTTLLTGLPPAGHGLRDGRSGLPEAETTLAEVYRDAGYATAGFVSGPFLKSSFGFGQGFDLYDDTIADVTHPQSHTGITTPALMDKVNAWLDDWERTTPARPFFLFVHVWDAHYDFAPPPPWDTYFDPDYDGTVTGERYYWNESVHAGMNPRDLDHIRALYDGEIRFIDEQLRALDERLRARRRGEDTIVAVTSDHGEEFFEHGLKGHRRALYEESLRIPLVVHASKRVPERVVETPVRLMDLPATLLSLSGLERPEGFGSVAGVAKGERAVDLSPLWEGKDDAYPEILFAELYPRYTAARGPRYKWMNDLKHPDREALYDLEQDPAETRNLIETHPEIARKLSREFFRWRSFWELRRPDTESVELTPEEKEHLRSLGYVD